MKQFNLFEWLQNKSRKVVTRDGRSVRIVCWDKLGDYPIIGCIKYSDDYEDFETYNIDGSKYSFNREDHNDLFFADEEESMNEFEARIYNLINFSDPDNYPSIKEVKEEAEILLDLAKEKILKDLPKWKKANEHKDLEKHIAILEENKVLLSNYLEEGDYYIDLEDLKALPKEE